ncbi:LolA family protein [Saccharopolyspora phatthalungensis]|uniref:Outer membrane lipoprotein-sorting protein n=1 Tax=Saccharopolyspora phatthalungensis TaxID=664693 RepID=A0A840QDY6_9PSEU|nr:outer membrane lipoprotein carrier protein LolA [Saccharopolyspora phatthalungensis]MBB5158040.1 outer membrane lipoprotein-sorting protein [Saccharopolyspora phatthalungensis]
MKRKNVAYTAAAGTAVGVLGLTMLALPVGAGAAPALPQVAPEQLVESVMRATPPALTGTVEVDNNLGLPAIPGAGQSSEMLANGTSQFRVWADGQGRHRVSVPSSHGEMTVVNDGSTVWKWDSGEQKVTRSPERAPEAADHKAPADPAAAAREIVGKIRQTSDVKVDGTASVAGRDAYELVLTPKPTERTVLREVRVAVDAEKRIPLELSVLTNGSNDPALQVGFSSVDMSAPDPGLFKFTPPAGAKVEDGKAEHGPQQPRQHPQGKVVGDGWDSVLVTQLPQQQPQKPEKGQDLRQVAERTGKPVSGPWGNGWVIGTAAGNALLTSDGRVAVGAVPEQVLTAALGEA